MIDAISMAVSILKLVFILFFVPLSAAALFGGSNTEPTANQHPERKLAFEKEIVSVLIDCGAADDNSIDTGVKHNISSEYSDDVNDQGETLRSFPDGTRNCYHLTPEGATINKKYLVRAGFVYGNYDKKNETPEFDLYIGVNKWRTVKLDDSATHIYNEIIYNSSTEYAEVCVVNTGSGVPFISVLELMVLDDSMYEVEPGTYLSSTDRYDVGATRRVSDNYGRDWDPLKTMDVDGWVSQTKETIENRGHNKSNRVSDTVWSSAVYPANPKLPISFQYGVSISHQVHLYLYFADIFYNGTREMRIDLNYGPTPTYVTLEQYLYPVTIGPLKINPPDDSVINFKIYSTSEVLLPPILNAYEFFNVRELPNQPTNLEDVDAMMDIKKVFKVTRNWQGDPCMPSNFSWQGINCNIDVNPPRIISLNLSSSGLTGELPESLSNLTAIQSLDLSYNELNGSLLESLAQLKDLKVLSLTGNKLTGSIPPDLKKKFKDTPDMLRLDGNQLSMSSACNKNKNHFVLALVPAVVALIIQGLY